MSNERGTGVEQPGPPEMLASPSTRDLTPSSTAGESSSQFATTFCLCPLDPTRTDQWYTPSCNRQMASTGLYKDVLTAEAIVPSRFQKLASVPIATRLSLL